MIKILYKQVEYKNMTVFFIWSQNTEKTVTNVLSFDVPMKMLLHGKDIVTYLLRYIS